MDISIPYENLLNEFLRTHPYQDVRIAGADYHYLLCGQGDTVLVFLTGGMGLSCLYMPYIAALEPEFRILTFDYPYEFDDNNRLADGISALLRHLHIASCILIGSSYGGYAAQIFARRHPEQTKGLCLFSTAGLSDKTIASLTAKYKKSVPVLLWILKHVPYSCLKPLMIRACMRHAENTSAEVHAYLLEMFRYIYRDYTRKLDVHMTKLLADLLNQTPCTAEEFAYLQDRILLILPENDDSFTPQMQKDLIDMMPGSVIVKGIDSGHLSTMLEADRYTEEIRTFVKGLEKT